MSKTYFENAYRSTMICVDSYENSEMKGSLYNPALEGGIRFESVMQFLLALEDLLDDMNFPQNFNAKRCFRPIGHELDIGNETTESRGEKASFVVRVLFRQNASWQGTVTWLDEKREESFRSVLELLLLMNSVLDKQKASIHDAALA